MVTNKNIITVVMKNCIGVNGIKLDESAAGMPVKFADRVIGYIKQADAAFIYINLWTSNWGIVYNNTSNEIMELSLYTPSLEVNLADPSRKAVGLELDLDASDIFGEEDFDDDTV